ncbi:MAG: dATP/dGTP diphosphohydrolase domain-containing protein [Nitrospiraceae bacterium]
MKDCETCLLHEALEVEFTPKKIIHIEPENSPFAEMTRAVLPTDSKARKDIPMARGALDYFPAAWAAVAELSRIGNEKHNPGEGLHWARGKSSDHADCILRHLAERGTLDDDGISHTTKVAWRALALLQEELEAQGAPRARGAR